MQKAHFLPVKALRVVVSFMVSKFDYVASGFPMEGPWLKKLQDTLNCKNLSNVWKQDTNPRHWQMGARAMVSLEVSVMVSWVARGCRNWEVVHSRCNSRAWWGISRRRQ